MVTSAVTRLTTTLYIELYGYNCGYKINYNLIHSFVWLQLWLQGQLLVQHGIHSGYCHHNSAMCKHHIMPAGVEGKMELGMGCIAQLILPCHATHGAEWNGQP